MHTEYKLKNDNSAIELSLHIGYAQRGKTRLMFGTVQFGEIRDGNFEHFVIGDNQNLKGKSLSIYTIVHDINPGTNATSVQIKLEGGNQPMVTPAVIKVVASGGYAYHLITINFY
jgi:hypothetical protein